MTTSDRLVVDLRTATKKFLPLAAQLMQASQTSRRRYRVSVGRLPFDISTVVHCLLAETTDNAALGRLRADVYQQRTRLARSATTAALPSDRFEAMFASDIPPGLVRMRATSLPKLAARATLALFHAVVGIADIPSSARELVVIRERETFETLQPLVDALCSETARKQLLGIPLRCHST